MTQDTTGGDSKMQSDEALVPTAVAEDYTPPEIPVIPDDDNEDDEIDEADLLPPDGLPSPASTTMNNEGEQPMNEAVTKPLPQVKAKYEVMYDGENAPINVGQSQAKKALDGVSPVYKNVAEQIAALADDPNSDGKFRIQILRRGPSSHNGFRLPLSTVIEELPPTPVPNVQTAIRDIHGGGDYLLRVVNAENVQTHSMPIRIDELQHPPKIPANATPINMREIGPMQGQSGGMYNMGPTPYGALGGADQELAELRKQEMKESTEHKIRMARRRRQKEEEAELEKEEKRMLLPQMESQRQIEALKESTTAQISAIKDLIQATLSKPSSDEGSTKILLEAMRVNSEQQAEASRRSAEVQSQNMQAMLGLVTALLTKKDDGGGNKEIIELVKANAEASKQTTQLMLESSRSENQRLFGMFTEILSKNLTQPDDKLKTYVEAMNSGRQQATEIFEMVQSLSGSDESLIDPENSLWGNVKALALRGLERLATGAMSGGGSAISGLANRVMTSSDPVFEAASAPMPTPSLPAPTPAPVAVPASQLAPAPVQAANPGRSVSLIEGMIDDDGQMISESVPIPVQQSPQPRPQPPQPQPQPQPQPATSSAPPVDEYAEEDLKMHVTEAIRLSLYDFKVGRKSHDWPDYAIDKWDRGFKVLLARSPDDAARIELIRHKCEPAIFEQLKGFLARGGQDVVYFTKGLQAVIQDVANEIAA